MLPRGMLLPVAPAADKAYRALANGTAGAFHAAGALELSGPCIYPGCPGCSFTSLTGSGFERVVQGSPEQSQSYHSQISRPAISTFQT
jgi:hypothetical protein